jgi:hypothetical protein
MTDTATFTFDSLPGVVFEATRALTGADPNFIQFTATTTTDGVVGEPVQLAGFLGPSDTSEPPLGA